MSGGVGFSRSARKSFDENRNLVKKKEPFQKIKDNPFIKESGKRSIKISPQLIEKLIGIKNSKKEAQSISGKILAFFVIFFLVLIIYSVMHFQ